MANCNLDKLTMDEMRAKHNSGIELRHNLFKEVKKNNPELSDVRNAYLAEAILEAKNIPGLLHENPQTLGHHMYRTVDGKEIRDPISVYFMEPSKIGYRILYTSTDFDLVNDFKSNKNKGQASLIDVDKRTGNVMLGEYEGRASYSPIKMDLAFNSLNDHMDNYKNAKAFLDPKNKTLLIPASEPKAINSTELKQNLDSGFTLKEEHHLTVLGFPQGRILKDLLANNPNHASKIQKLINNTDLTYEETNEIYKIERDTEPWVDWKDHSKGKKKQHDEAIIVKVKAPGVEKLVGQINNLLGTNLPIPFPHISLATKGSKMGIGIANKTAFDKLNPKRLDVGIQQEFQFEEQTFNAESGTKIEFNSANTDRISAELINDIDKANEIFNSLKAGSDIEITPEHEALLRESLKDVIGSTRDVIPEMIQFINNNASMNYGKIVMKDQEGKNGLKQGIYIGSTKEAKTAGNQKSPAEMYVHELQHASFEYALRDNPTAVADAMQDVQRAYELFLENATEEDFMPSMEKSINRTLERQIAKARLEYLKDPVVGIHEFMAEYKSSLVVKTVLQDRVTMSDKKRAPGKNLFEKLVNAVKMIWDFVVRYLRNNQNNIDGFSAMTKFMDEITNINNRAAKQIEEQNIIMRKAEQIGDFMNTKGSTYLKKLGKKIGAGTTSNDPVVKKEVMEKRLEEHLKDMNNFNDKDANKLSRAWSWGKALRYIVSDAVFSKEEHAAGRFEAFISTALPAFGLGRDKDGASTMFAPEGTINQLLRAVRDSDIVETDIEKLGLFANKVEMNTETDMHAQSDLIDALFSEELSKEDNAALVYGMADTDLVSLFSEDLGWTQDQKIEHIKKALKDENSVNEMISEVETQLSVMITDSKDHDLVLQQAKGLGEQMITGNSSYGQMTNAYMILGTKSGTISKSRMISENKKPGANKTRAFIDQLATLHALKNTDSNVKKRTLDLLNKDQDAFIGLMKYDMTIKQYMKEFNRKDDYEFEMTRKKGKHDKIGSSYINQKVDLISNQDALLESDYKLVKGLTEDSKYGVYINKSYTEAGWKANGTIMTNDGQEINSYINIFKSERHKGKEDVFMDAEYKKEEKLKVEAELKSFEKRVKEELMLMRNKQYVPKSTGMRPVFSTNKSGEIYVTDMDINVDRQRVEQELEMKTTISSVISKSTANAASIYNSKANNLRILDLAESDALDNYEYDRDYNLGGKKNAMAYMRIGPAEGNPDPSGKQTRSQQIWNILPRYMKAEINKRHKLNTNRDIIGYMHSAGLNNTGGIHGNKFYTKKAEEIQEKLDVELKKEKKELFMIKKLYNDLANEVSRNVLDQSNKDKKNGNSDTYAMNAMKKIKEIRNREPYIPVRRNLVRNYFGNREFTFFGDGASGALFPIPNKSVFAAGVKMMKYIDMLWKHIIKITKADIVVRNLAVLGMNILSNILLGVLQGKNPFTEIKMQIQGIRMLHSWIEDNKKIKGLELKLKSGNHTQADIDELKRLKNNVKNNPAKPLIDAGLYTASAEDLTNTDLHKTGYLDDKFDAAGNKIPSKLRDAMKFVYMTKDTAPFKVLLLSMQYSDFAARYSTYYTMKEKGIPLHVIEKKVLDNQINYNFGHGELLQWLNDRGFIMFTMFYERIQRVLKNTTIDKPFNVLLAAFLGDFVYDNSPFGDSVIERDMRFYSPADIIDKQMEIIPIMASFK